MQPIGAFVLVFLEAQIKYTCISLNKHCIFPIKQCIIKQLLLNSDFVISGVIKVFASVISFDLPYSGCHKNLIQVLFINKNVTCLMDERRVQTAAGLTAQGTQGQNSQNSLQGNFKVGKY